jgi:transposase
VRIKLRDHVRRDLEELVHARSTPNGLAQRARIILLAARGLSNAAIARLVECTPKVVAKWRKRFRDRRKPESLQDAPRSGRPPEVPVWVRLELVKLACDRPVAHKQRFRDVWTHGALQAALLKETGFELSQTEIRRVLRVENIRPHRVRLWLHSPDPNFRTKVRAICDVYLRDPAPGETVVCIDEKTGMQALEHKHPFQQAAPGRAGRREFEYIRHGTCTLFAAFNPHTGEVFGECSKTRKLPDLMRFMEHLARRYPTGPVTVIWDNLNIHHGKVWEDFNRRHEGRFRFLYTPLHASWVNQVEIWFGLLSRRVLKHASFPTLRELRVAVLGFIRHWNQHEAHPFNWTFRGRFKKAA